MSASRAGQHEVGEFRRDVVRQAVHALDAGDVEQVHPLLQVGDEHQHPGRPGDERLVVAGDGEPVLERLIVDLDDRVEHHVARRRCPHRGVEDGLLLVVGERRRRVGARRAARVQQVDRLVSLGHSGAPWLALRAAHVLSLGRYPAVVRLSLGRRAVALLLPMVQRRAGGAACGPARPSLTRSGRSMIYALASASSWPWARQ